MLLPVFLFFGFQPHIYFGSYFGMNFDLSILQIFLGLFVLVSLPQVWRARKDLARNRAVWLTALFVVIQAVSLFWALNLVRATMTLVVILLLFAVFLSMVSNKKLQKLLPAFLQVLVVAAVGVSVFAWYQIVGDALGLPAWATLLPDVYGSGVFGFARPTALAAEPQFLASLLVAPILLLAHSFIKKEDDSKKTAWILLFLVATLVATVSRGAALGLAIGLVALLVVDRKYVKRCLAAVGIFVLGTFLALCAVGLAAQVNQRVGANFYGSIRGAVSHYTLGKVNLPDQTSSLAPAGSQGTEHGYVEESTTSRLSNSDMALSIWKDDGKNIALGVGLGSTGYAYKQYQGYHTDKAIVNNEYLELLLEGGLLSLLAFLAMLACLVIYLAKSKQLVWIAILMAFAVQWCFFSGYPNAMHVFVLLGVAYLLASAKKRSPRALKST